MTEFRPLKLAALDEEDLSVLSAHVQDAIIKAGEVRWSAAENRFLLPMNRFAWELTTQKRTRREGDQRRRAVLQFDRVLRARSTGLSANDRDAVLSILAITFAPENPPGGAINIVCSGETVLRLDVECIEARLTDIGGAWSASRRPKHRGAAS